MEEALEWTKLKTTDEFEADGELFILPFKGNERLDDKSVGLSYPGNETSYKKGFTQDVWVKKKEGTKLFINGREIK